jgi:hypothetical protein
MCFSADASFTSGALLLPAGVYSVAVAARRNLRYLPLAATPLIFGIQQFCEGFVWMGLEHHDHGMVKTASIAFLFFAMAFWPTWIPIGALVLEPNRRKRLIFIALTLVGFFVGVGGYVMTLLHYDEWLTVQIIGHSLYYNLSMIPGAQSTAGVIWRWSYMILVTIPLLISRERKLWILSVSIFASALISHLVYWHAFLSVWCFIAAWLSMHICYVIYRLPKADIVVIQP